MIGIIVFCFLILLVISSAVIIFKRSVRPLQREELQEISAEHQSKVLKEGLVNLFFCKPPVKAEIHIRIPGRKTEVIKFSLMLVSDD
jgi:hypothetical protein